MFAFRKLFGMCLGIIVYSILCFGETVKPKTCSPSLFQKCFHLSYCDHSIARKI